MNGPQNLTVWAVRTCQGQPRSSCRPGALQTRPAPPLLEMPLWVQRLWGQPLGFQSWLHPLGADNWNTVLNPSVPPPPPLNYRGTARPASQDSEEGKCGHACAAGQCPQACVPAVSASSPVHGHSSRTPSVGPELGSDRLRDLPAVRASAPPRGSQLLSKGCPDRIKTT